MLLYLACRTNGMQVSWTETGQESVKPFLSLGIFARELRRVGVPAETLRRSGFEAKELRKGGYTVEELLRAGYIDTEIQ